MRQSLLITAMILLMTQTARPAEAPTTHPSRSATDKATWMGMAVEEVSPYNGFEGSFPEGVRVFVTGVIEGGPSDKAGICFLDGIIAVDGQPIVSGPQLVKIVRAHKPGDRVSITITRSRAQIVRSVTLEEAEVPPTLKVGDPFNKRFKRQKADQLPTTQKRD